MSAPVHRDAELPDILNPVLAMELKRGLKTRMFPFLILTVLLLMTAFFFSSLSRASESAIAAASAFVVPRRGPDLFGSRIVTALPFLLFLPIVGLVNLRRERAARLLELVYLSPQSPWHVLHGKFLSLMTLLLLAATTALPFVVIRYYLGGVDVAMDLLMVLYLVALSAVACAGGLLLGTYRHPLLTLLGLVLASPLVAMIVVPVIVILGYCATLGPLLIPPVLWFGALGLLHMASLRLSPAVTQWKTASRLSLFFFCASSLVMMAVGRSIDGFHAALLVFLPGVIFNALVALQIDHPSMTPRNRLLCATALPLTVWLLAAATQGWPVLKLIGYTISFVPSVLIPFSAAARFTDNKDWGTVAWIYVFIQMIAIFVAVLVGLLLGDGLSARYQIVAVLPVGGLLASVNDNIWPAAVAVQAAWAATGILFFRRTLDRCRNRGWPPLRPPELLVYQRAILDDICPPAPPVPPPPPGGNP